jgi:hypothetical protein
MTEPRRETRSLGKSDTAEHLRVIREQDPELEAKADAWSRYFNERGVQRSAAAILETWARLQADVPPWPPAQAL